MKVSICILCAVLLTPDSGSASWGARWVCSVPAEQEMKQIGSIFINHSAGFLHVKLSGDLHQCFLINEQHRPPTRKVCDRPPLRKCLHIPKVHLTVKYMYTHIVFHKTGYPCQIPPAKHVSNSPVRVCQSNSFKTRWTSDCGSWKFPASVASLAKTLLCSF